MDEREFLLVADAELARIEGALDRLQSDDTFDFDYELKPGGIIEITCEDDSKIIINRHAAAREIWLAARSGGLHFSPPATEGGGWVSARTAEDLVSALSRCLTEQSGEAVRLAW